MNPKPWLATYRDNGIPEQINADAYPSVVHMLDAAMARFADKPAFRSFGQTLSYADVDRLSAAFAAWLQHTLGVKRGDRVAVMLPNFLAFPIAFLGIARAGAVQVNVNPAYRAHELAYVLDKSGMKALFLRANDVRSNYRQLLEEAMAGRDLALRHVVYLGEESWDRFLEGTADVPRHDAPTDPHSVVNIQYTSGTTGFPKGVLLTHRNLLASGRAVAAVQELTPAFEPFARVSMVTADADGSFEAASDPCWHGAAGVLSHP